MTAMAVAVNEPTREMAAIQTGDPRRLMNAEIEAGEPHASQSGGGHPLGMSGGIIFVLGLGTGDQPDGDDGQDEAGDGPAAGCAFEGDVDHGRDGRAEQRGDRSREPHLAGGERA